MARKKRGGDSGEGASWMDTYGDLVTLLLCFFVLLYSSSTMDAAKWNALVMAFTGVGPGDSAIESLDISTVVKAPVALEIDTSMANTPNEAEQPDKGNANEDLDNFNALVTSLRGFVEGFGLSADFEEDIESLSVTMRLPDNIFFDSGDATLKPESYEILDGLADLLADNMIYLDEVSVEGHTDTDPIKTTKYKDNLDLSTDRASNTVRYLSDSNEGVERSKIVPKGMSEYHPVAPNDTAEGKAANRRVDFVFQSKITGD